MDTSYPGGGPIGYYRKADMHADDRRGVRLLYSDGTSRRDVSVSAYRRAGSSSTTANSSPSSVTRGTNFTTNYTVENLGTQSESVHVRFYLSTNNYITTYADTYLGSTTWSMPVGSLASSTKTLYIPTSLNAGTYYVGYIADPLNSIPEANESNNFVANNRTITVN